MKKKSKSVLAMALVLCMVACLFPQAALAASLSEPVMESAELLTNGVTITWGAVDGAEKYGIYRQVEGEDAWTRVGSTTETTYSSYGVTSGNAYLFTVRAESSDGNSAYGESTVRIFYMKAPTMSSIANGDGCVAVSWSAVDGAESYGVFFRTSDDADWEYAGSTEDTSYELGDVVSGTTYQVTVRSEQGENSSLYGSSVKSICYLDEPEMLSAEKLSNGVTITWAAVDGAEKYGVYRMATGDEEWTRVGSTTDTTYDSHGVVDGNGYLFTVRAEGSSTYSVYGNSTVSIYYGDSYVLADGETFNSYMEKDARTVTFGRLEDYEGIIEDAEGVQIGETEDDEIFLYDINGDYYILADLTISFNADSSKMFYMTTDVASAYNGKAITSIVFDNIDTSNVTDMSQMFGYLYNVTELDLSGFDTSNVTTMYRMFNNCESLTSLDLSSFNTSNVTDMSYMFCNCYSLQSLNVSSFDTSNVTTMKVMFYECEALETLDLSSFDTAKVTDMGSMFSYCYALTDLDITSFDTSSVTTMNNMFSRCSSLDSLDLSSFDTTNVNNMYMMFYDCSSLEILDLRSFETPSLRGFGGMFYGCSSLTRIYVSDGWTTESVLWNCTLIEDTFTGCTSLIGGTGWRVGSIDDGIYARIGTSNTRGYFTHDPDHTTELTGYVAPTCTEEGYSGDEICPDCGIVIEEGSVLAAKGHAWDSGVVTKEATTEEEGIRTYTCTECGETKTEVIEKVEVPVELKAPSVSLTVSEGVNGKVKLTASIDDYENSEEYYEVTAKGFVYITKAKLGAKSLSINTSGRTKVTVTGINSDGSYVYSMTPSSSSTSYVYRAWIQYKNSAGKTVTVYSSAVYTSYDALAE